MRALLFFGLILIIFLGIWIVMQRIERFRAEAETESTTQEAQSSEQIVACQHCGVHVPQSEAISVATEEKGTLHFCCQNHLEQFIEHKGQS